MPTRLLFWSFTTGVGLLLNPSSQVIRDCFHRCLIEVLILVGVAKLCLNKLLLLFVEFRKHLVFFGPKDFRNPRLKQACFSFKLFAGCVTDPCTRGPSYADNGLRKENRCRSLFRRRFKIPSHTVLFSDLKKHSIGNVDIGW